MSENTETQGAASAASESTEAAEKPATRRRASRRVTTPAAEVPAAEAPSAEASAAAAPAAEAPAEETAPKKRAPRTRKKAEDAPAADAGAENTAANGAEASAPEAPAAEAPAAEAPAEEAAPKKRAPRTRKKVEEAPAATASDSEAAPAATDADAENAAEKSATKRRTSRRATKPTAEATEQAPAEGGDTSGGAVTAAQTGADDAHGSESPASAQTSGAQSAEAQSAEAQSADEAPSTSRNRRSRSRKAEAEAPVDDASDNASKNADKADKSEQQNTAPEQSENGDRQADDANGNGNGRKGKSRGNRNQDRQNDKGSDKNESGRNDRSDRSGDRQDGDSGNRSSRTRQRDRKRRGQGDDFEPEITEDDVLLPIAGILDVLDNYAFVRTSGYLPGTSDVYVSLGQVKKHGLRKGDAVVGAIRQPREGDGGRQKYNAIVKVDAVNGRSAEESQSRAVFADSTPVYPQQRVLLENADSSIAARAVDLLAPLGLGQRGLVVGRPGTGKSAVLRTIASAVTASHPDAHLMVVLVDERPEEVTELQRTIKGEVVASTFDGTAEDHLTVAELSVERAKRLVELGHDVVVLLDSITVLGRAHLQRTPSSRGAEAGIDLAALQPIKRLLAAARNVENGGSLTIIATALEKSGSKLDKAILNEIQASANSRIRLIGEGGQPEVDPTGTFAVRPELLVGEAEAAAVRSLRSELGDEDAEAVLTKRLSGSASNTALLAEVRSSGKF
ncbi:transcription termination factor Rho [Leucobacter sp. GX24907]